jgi:hypothetical protein
MAWQETNQLWVSLRVGTDVMPLLANVCSNECESAIPTPPENYIPHPHKGSAQLKQPPDENELFRQEIKEWEKEEKEQQLPSKPENNTNPAKPIQLLKLIRKIWEK